MKILDFDEKTLKYPNHPKVKDLVDNEEEYIAYLKTEYDKVLARKLESVRIQMGWAVEQQKWVEYEVLKLFKDMIIAARVLKMEENPDRKEYDKPVAKPKKKKEKKITDEKQQETEEAAIEEIPETDDTENIEDRNSRQLTLFDFKKDD
ncbi:MAG: hypothetical protein HY738_19815 [Bacteroidia bacterium]|nr:hypothetical protein [Bacteroidia bacterium]